MIQGEDIEWQPFQEPLRATLARTGMIALIGGLAVAARFGGLARWPAATLLIFWPSFGGHWVEFCFLNYLRPRLPVARAVQVTARVAVWFVGGACLLLAMRLTAAALAGSERFEQPRWPAWWVGGIAFIAIELAVHLVPQLRGRPSFYNGRS